MRFHVEIAACEQERQKKEKKQEWAMCAGTQPSSINSHLRRRRCVLRVVVLITNSNAPWCLRVDQQQRSLMLACGTLATCYINVPMVDQNLSLPVIFLYDTYVLVLNSNYSVLAIGPLYWYVIPPHICYVSISSRISYILLQSNT